MQPSDDGSTREMRQRWRRERIRGNIELGVMIVVTAVLVVYWANVSVDECCGKDELPSKIFLSVLALFSFGAYVWYFSQGTESDDWDEKEYEERWPRR
jgi:hypothetical protein